MLYYRRKILLALLEVFDGQLTATSLQKYLFLFTRRQNTKSFDFIPYKYGCYSFQANQDLSTMQKYGYIEMIEQANVKSIRIKEPGEYKSIIDVSDLQALNEIKQAYGNYSQQELIRHTYQKYPYYALNSTIAHELLNEAELETVEKQRRKFDVPQLFSIGYEGISLETYINKLIINDVRLLCDVRKNAFSQKYGFSKSQLKKACEGVGIQYLHLPELGIESENRKELHTQKDYDELFDQYEKTTLKNNIAGLLKIKDLLEQGSRIALTCFEKDTKQCHRTRVANALMNQPDITYTFKAL